MTPRVTVATAAPAQSQDLTADKCVHSVAIMHLRWIISVKIKDKGKLALNENVLQICSKLPFFVYDNEVVEIVPWCSRIWEDWVSFVAVLIFKRLLRYA